MERRKAELKSTSEQLKEECESVVHILNKIIKKDHKNVNIINNFSNKQILENQRYFLNVRQFQHLAIEKLLELGLSLEEFLNDNDDIELENLRERYHSTLSLSTLKTFTELETYSTIDSADQIITNNENSEIPSSENEATKIDKNKTTHNNKTGRKCIADNLKCIKTPVAGFSETKITETHCNGSNELKLVAANESVSQTDNNKTNGTILTHSKENISYSSEYNVSDIQDRKDDYEVYCINKHVNDKNKENETHSLIGKNKNEMIDLQHTETKLSSSTRSISSDTTQLSDFKNGKKSLSMQTLSPSMKSESSDYPVESDKSDKNKITSTELSSSENVNIKPIKSDTVKTNDSVKTTKSLTEKLKTKKLLSRKDRYLQNLPKPIMPDLSFKPSTKLIELSDDYVSCNSSASSTQCLLQKEKKKKKRRSDKAARQVEATIETPKVPHLMLQEPPIPFVNMQCVVSCAKDPSEIYINVLDEYLNELDCLALQISEIYGGTVCPFSSKEDAKEQLGRFCVAYVEEYKSWYRTEVIHWHLNSQSYRAELVTIQLVDYGHTVDISYKILRPLIIEFCHVPRSAIKCHFAYLYPPNSTQDHLIDIWPTLSKDFLNKILEGVEHVVFNVTYIEEMSTSWAIDIIRMDEQDKDISLGQMLIDNSVAVEIIPDSSNLFKNRFLIRQLKTAQGYSGIKNNMTEEEKLEKYYENTSSKEPENLDEAMVCYKANDEARICQFTRKDGTCYKGIKCKLEHVSLRLDGITTDKQYVYRSAFRTCDLPKAGETIDVQVTCVCSVNTFYVCRIDRTTSLSFHPGLSKLQDDLNKEQSIAKYKPLTLQPARGEMVLVKNCINDCWCRAQVQDVYQSAHMAELTVQVFIVDFGEVLDVPLPELRHIQDVFLHLPFQAIQCRLYNVIPIPEQDTEIAKGYFESHFLCQTFKAEVMYSSSSIEVLLKKMTGEDVGEQIIDDGFGQVRTEYFFPKDTETLLVD